jgi:hypothetical protein
MGIADTSIGEDGLQYRLQELILDRHHDVKELSANNRTAYQGTHRPTRNHPLNRQTMETR